MTSPSDGAPPASSASSVSSAHIAQTASRTSSGFAWAVATCAKTGQIACGDAYRVRELPALAAGGAPVANEQGVALVVVVDGIGHGPDARAAADCALDAFVDDAGVDEALRGTGFALARRLERAHHAARRTRGCVLSAALVAGDTLAWIGVGNVEGVVRKAGARERLLTIGGIVGERLPNVIVRDVPFLPGDAVIFATDGAPGAVLDETVRFDDVAGAAHALLARHATGADDALVFVGVRDG